MTTGMLRAAAQHATSAAKSAANVAATTHTYAKHMASQSKTMIPCWKTRAVPAPSVTGELVNDISQLTIIIRLARCVDYCVQHVTSRWGDSVTTPPGSMRQQAIYEIRLLEEHYATMRNQGENSEVDRTDTG